MIAATGSFYSARGIRSQASVGAAVDEERWAGKTKSSICDSYLSNYFLVQLVSL